AAQMPAAPESTRERWMELQRGIGNQAVSRVLQRRTEEPRTARPGLMLQRECAGGGGAGSGGERAGSSPKEGVETERQIDEPGDVYEQEADRVAAQVMRMAAPEVALSSASPQINRKCATRDAKEELQKKPAGPPAATAEAAEAPAVTPDLLQSPGQPLDAAT